MHRFFVDPDIIRADELSISGSDVRHIRDVLRLKPGDKILTVDGTGAEYEVALESIGRDQVTGRIIGKNTVTRETKLQLTVAQAVPKSDKMDTVIRMGTELGVKEFIPVITERVVVQGNFEHKLARWRRICVESCKQSGRTVIPEVREPVKFPELVRDLKDWQLAVIPWEVHKGESLKDVIKDTSITEVIVFIGPEGGFSHEEAELAKSAGVVPVSLGSRILRTDTAAVAATANIMQIFSEI